MQFSKLLFATLLATFTYGTPLPPDQSAPRDVFSFEASESSINDCGDSTFINQSSTGSPLVSDCLQITYNIAGGGTWTIGTSGQRQLVQYGTCAFGVTVLGDAWYAYNQDIIDLINSSIQLFSWYGLVGAKGDMNCQGGIIGGLEVEWGLYHT